MINTKSFYILVQDFERDLIHEALLNSKGKVSVAAKMLRLNRTTLNEKFKKLGIEVSKYRAVKSIKAIK